MNECDQRSEKKLELHCWPAEISQIDLKKKLKLKINRSDLNFLAEQRSGSQIS